MIQHCSVRFFFGYCASNSHAALLYPIDAVIDILQQWMHQDDPELNASNVETRVSAMRSYLRSLLRKTESNNEVLLTAVVYLQRVRASGAYPLNRATFCILVSVCLYLATKFLHDRVYAVKHWSVCSGFSIDVLKSGERLVLGALHWMLFTSYQELLKLMLRRHVPLSITFCSVSPVRN